MFVRWDINMNAGVFLLLGTNLGDRNNNLDSALNAIASTVGAIKNKSSVYETAAWGKTNQPSFYNMAIEVESPLNPHDILDALIKIEAEMGRQRAEKWGERIIDIDMLFYGNQIINTHSLTIPHPQIPYRRFTLIPVNEIAPEFIHPELHKKIYQLLTECADNLDVTKVRN